MGIAQNTKYRVLRKFEEGVGAKEANKMIKEILSKAGVSQATMGRKYGVQRTMIGKVLYYICEDEIEFALLYRI